MQELTPELNDILHELEESIHSLSKRAQHSEDVLNLCHLRMEIYVPCSHCERRVVTLPGGNGWRCYHCDGIYCSECAPNHFGKEHGDKGSLGSSHQIIKQLESSIRWIGNGDRKEVQHTLKLLEQLKRDLRCWQPASC